MNIDNRYYSDLGSQSFKERIERTRQEITAALWKV